MADNTIRNSADLERALSNLTPQTPSREESDSNNGDEMKIDPIQSPPMKPSVIPGLSSVINSRGTGLQHSSNKLLMDLFAAQHESNVISRSILDAMLRLEQRIERMEGRIEAKMDRSYEIESAIARNTVNIGGTATGGGGTVPSTMSTGSRGSSKSILGKCGDYNLPGSVQVACEMIMGIIKQADITLRANGCKYFSSRELERKHLERLVREMTKRDMILPEGNIGKLHLPSTSSESAVYLASKIGSENKAIKPILNPTIIHGLFEDTKCRAMTDAISDAITRLKKMCILLPHYEADIIRCLIKKPYFNEEGGLEYNEKVLNPSRSLTPIERKAETANHAQILEICATILDGTEQTRAVSKVLGRG